MPSDALHYSFLAKELNDCLSDGKVEKITMPEKDEIVLGIRSRGKNVSLLLSAAPAGPRCHLTAHAKENPSSAPTFLMHLRKHIGGAKILGVECVPYERILKIRLLTRNELAVEDGKTLIAEIMGKYSNIILVNADGTISDSIKRINLDTSSKRQVLPGLKYLSAPAQDRCDVGCENEVTGVLEAFKGGNLSAYLLNKLRGLAPVSIEEAVFRALGKTDTDVLSRPEKDAVLRELTALYTAPTSPCVRYQDGRAADFYIRQYVGAQGEFKNFDTLSQAMDEYFYTKDKANRFHEKAHHLTTALKSAISRTEKKLGAFIQKRESCTDLEKDKLFGELITANIYKIKLGMKHAALENYYDDYSPVVIPLEENKTPQANAQNYFKRYTKKKKTLEQLETHIRAAQEQLEYYDTIALAFSLCSETAEIDDLYAEMEQAGLIRKKVKQTKKNKPKPSSPIVTEIENFTVKIGKNNMQNDELSKHAKGDDMWLHTQKIHGSHVIIAAQGKTIPPAVIEKAAAFAAYYSKAGQSQNVPVDYTPVKYVTKPNAAPPGKVIYTHQNTIYVNPLPAILEPDEKK